MALTVKLSTLLLLLTTADGLTTRSRMITRSIASSRRLDRASYFDVNRSHRQSNSRLTSTHVEARPISRPLLSLFSKKVVSSVQLLSKTFRRRGPQRMLIGSILVLIMLFGPAFSPAANAASTLGATSVSAPTVFTTHSRALGTFNFLPTKAELELCFRLLYASCSGAFIGLERSSQDRPAGVRTMALVGLGACIYAVCSTHGFLPASALGYAPGSPMLANVKCDPSRMAANVASGVGFIGAGAIHKSKMHGNGTEAQNVVAGLTTAAAIWVSAAVGVASATGLYFVSAVAALSTVGILRFAKVTKEDEPGFSWGPRPLEIEERVDVVKHHDDRGTPLIGVKNLQEKHQVSGVRKSYQENFHADKTISKKRHIAKSDSPVSKIDIKICKDPQLEQYLRKHDKEEGYACLEQDVRILESRVHGQQKSSFKP